MASICALLPAAIYVVDASGYLTFFNDAAAELWGRRPVLGEARWCGSEYLFLADMTPLPHEQSSVAEALAGRTTSGGEFICQRPDGSRIHFIAHPRTFLDEAGAVVGAISMLVDISHQKREEELEERLAAIVESSDDAIVSKNLDGIIESWNHGAQQLFGYTAEEAIGRSILMLIPHDRQSEETAIVSRIRQGQRVPHYETLRQRKDGSLVEVSLTVSPVRDRSGRVIGASKIARDITLQKNAERQIMMLMREVNHRVKNQYSVILSMIRETRRRTQDPKTFEKQVRDRIMALARSHDLLVTAEWNGAQLRDLIAAQLESFLHDEALVVDGPDVTLRPNAVQYLGIAFHELATNATKYGALSGGAGRIAITWTVETDPSGEEILRFRWQERCGPQVAAPTHSGFGSVVLERVTPTALLGNGEVRFDSDGLSWMLVAPMSSVAACDPVVDLPPI